MAERPEEEFDLAGGRVSAGQKGRDQTELESRRDRRLFRLAMFRILKGLFLAYLVGLLAVFLYIFFCRADDIAAMESSAALAFFGVALGLFSAIPLSLAITMRHIATDGTQAEKEAQDAGFSPAQVALLRAIIDIVRPPKD